MLTGYDLMKLRTMADCGLGIREICRQTALSRETVRKYLRADRNEAIVWGYMRESFLWPLESKLKAEGRSLDVDTANAEVGIVSHGVV